jgi:glyoxylase-like metal-dependent hydrolase (beta-lactamase superfamily II)
MAHAIEHTFATPVEVEPGILRLTLPLPSGPRHVHCYLLRGDDGWTLVDTGLGLDEAPWDTILAQIDGPVVRIFVTHMHPDHVGGVNAATRATGAPVFQGRLDFAQCEQVWGSGDWPERIAGWFLRNGMPREQAKEIIEHGHVFADFMRFDWRPSLLEEGDEIDGWAVIAVPGNSDGHLALHRNGVLIAGDSILTPITPAVGLYPESRPDPLGDYIQSLHDIATLDLRVSYGGHGVAVEEPAARALAIIEHHDERLDRAAGALDGQPRTGHEISHTLFSRELGPIHRRMAVAETLSHLERLVVLDRAARAEDDRTVTYTAAQPGGRHPA